MLKLLGDTYFLVSTGDWAIKNSLIDEIKVVERQASIPVYSDKKQIGWKKITWELIQISYEGSKTIFVGGKSYHEYCVDYEKDCGRFPIDSSVFLNLELFNYLMDALIS